MSFLMYVTNTQAYQQKKQKNSSLAKKKSFIGSATACSILYVFEVRNIFVAVLQ
jgi:hypothetical protein